MSDEVRITCEICDDLFPLVEDGIASEESRRAVLSHISICQECQNKYPAFSEINTEAEESPETVGSSSGKNIGSTYARIPEKDDARILMNIRGRISLWLLLCISVSLMLGVLIVASGSSSPWLMLIIFPLICGVVYWIGGRAWRWVPPTAALFWILISLLMYADNYSNWRVAILDTILSAVFPLLLSCVGALAAALLKYAFKGEF